MAAPSGVTAARLARLPFHVNPGRSLIASTNGWLPDGRAAGSTQSVLIPLPLRGDFDNH